MTDPRNTTSDQGPANDHSLNGLAASEIGVVAADRYEILDEVARGGMGIVYRAMDTVLRREVALKLLLNVLDAGSGSARRFVGEARIAAQLQHPGIPAIHDLGAMPDGRPFLAMRLIKGGTLAELLKDKSRTHNLLAVFEQVCQAIGYAHAHGVIHRDLKPANVMVGAFGEVQVMDWGLAKVLTEPAGSSEATAVDETTAANTEIQLPRDADDATRAGSVLGTPAYMPPEQAIGAVDQVDARSDVFGLGAMLCTILTGQPPYVGTDSESTRQLAARARQDDAVSRLNSCGADPGLVALCKRCLSPEKVDRPADAGEVAAAVAALRGEADERARRAELERVQAEAEAREQKKRRRVQLGLALAVGLLLAASGAFAWWQDKLATTRKFETENREREDRERLARNADALSSLLTRCEAALQMEDTERAATALEEVDRRLSDGGGDELRGRAKRCRADLALLRELDAIDTLLWTPVGNEGPPEKMRTARLPGALARYGIKPGDSSAGKAAKQVNESLVRERLLTALDLWLAFRPSWAALEVLRLADPDPYRDAVRDAFAARASHRLAELARRPEALAQPPGFAAVLGQYPTIPVERRREVLGAALQSRPNNFALLMALGSTYPFNRQAGADERVRWFQAAIAAHPRSLAAHINLADALYKKGDLDQAEACSRELIRLDPKFAPGHNALGLALKQKGNLDGATACFREAIRLDPKEPTIHFNLASALRAKGDLGAAAKSYNKALWLFFAKQNHDSIGKWEEAIQIDPNDAASHNKLAWALATGPDGTRDGRRAVEHATKACELTGWTVPNGVETLAAAYAEAGDFDKAIEYQKKALAYPSYKTANGKRGADLLQLYMQKKPYRDPAMAKYIKVYPPDEKQKP